MERAHRKVRGRVMRQLLVMCDLYQGLGKHKIGDANARVVHGRKEASLRVGLGRVS